MTVCIGALVTATMPHFKLIDKCKGKHTNHCKLTGSGWVVSAQLWHSTKGTFSPIVLVHVWKLTKIPTFV